jgi:lipid II:glycine glycyltransferase (peptidoglycan interpeptide bridge formation enzyme)
LDLTGSEEEWLARMKQKTRYNLRIAFKKGVQVREGGYDDFPLIYRMYAETSIRDGFIIRLEDYYSKVWRTFIEHNMADLLVAEYQNEPIAALFLFHFANKAWYLYGMSSQVHRDKMPNYLLQWKAMQLARDHGCKSYDLWGAPDKLDESDPLWGVYRFKEGLGAKVIHTLGAWDYTSRPQLYRLFNRTLPAILNIMRRRGEKSIRRMVSA